LDDHFLLRNNTNTFELPTLDQECQFIETSNTFEDQFQSLLNSVEYNSNSSTIDPPNTYQEIIKQKLGKWSIDFDIPQNAVNALLELLKNDANMTFLLKDYRTLLHSRSSTLLNNIHEIVPGSYYHFGLATGIVRFSSTFPLDDVIRLAIGIDGLPLTKSSASQFWPILAYIQPYHKYVFPIGIYHGYQKPKDSNDYLKYLISEIIQLTSEGIVINDVIKKISIEVFCCDSPAKPYLLRIKGHAGFFSCSRYNEEGEYIHNRVCFPYIENGCKNEPMMNTSWVNTFQ